MAEKLSKSEMKKIYDLIKKFHKKYLEKFGVKLPKYDSKDALCLIYLARDYPNTHAVSKEELTDFFRLYYPNQVDVQQARHLGAQKGWFIESGTRGNGEGKIKPREYLLKTLEKPYPNYHGHRIEQTEDWEEIKKQYDYRCATCGSKEDEKHLHWKNATTKLQKAHMNPRKPLEPGNIIPQCDWCNRGDRNRWVYDERGRVIKIANPRVVKSCDKYVQREIYKILYNKYGGENPNE